MKRAVDLVYPFKSGLSTENPSLSKELEEVWRSLNDRLVALSASISTSTPASTDLTDITIELANLSTDVAALKAAVTSQGVFSFSDNGTILIVTTPSGTKYVSLSDTIP